MKTLRFIFFIFLLLIIVGCENSKEEETLKQVKSLIQSEQYEKALNLLEEPLKDKENKEAQSLKEQITKVQEALKAEDQNEIDSAISLFEDLKDNKKNMDSIVSKSKQHLKDLTAKKEYQREINTKLDHIEELIHNQNFEEASSILEPLSTEISTHQYLKNEQAEVKELTDKNNTAIAKQKELNQQEKAKHVQELKKQQENTAITLKQAEQKAKEFIKQTIGDNVDAIINESADANSERVAFFECNDEDSEAYFCVYQHGSGSSLDLYVEKKGGKVLRSGEYVNSH
ncbi:hypothetical protein [Bacillus rhizoplanae]|uniref:hypothetical protein n=1 Tax=Bacillus rhizoplanae TaxID=2880966 RepID=UPI003D1AE4A1